MDRRDFAAAGVAACLVSGAGSAVKGIGGEPAEVLVRLSRRLEPFHTFGERKSCRAYLDLDRPRFL